MHKVVEKLPDVDQLQFELDELDRKIERESRKYKQLYDDYYDGVIKNAMLFEQMSTECNNRIESYTAQKEKLQSDLKSTTEHFDSVDKFIGLMQRFKKVESLNKEILNTLVDKIEVGERVSTAAKEYVQNVRIKYKFIGRLN